MHIFLSCGVRRRAVLICALVGGVAQAQVLDVPLKWTYKGAVYLRSYPSDGTCSSVYTVPAGQTLRLTDFMLANYSTTTRAMPYQFLCSGTSSGCGSPLTSYVTAPAGSTLINNTTTGYRVDAGQSLYTCNYAATGDLAEWSFTGYLYTNP